MSDGYAEAARAKKVAKLLAKVPVGNNAAESAKILTWLEAFTADDRADFASFAEVNKPSATTWNALLSAVSQRKTTDEAFADADRMRRTILLRIRQVDGRWDPEAELTQPSMRATDMRRCPPPRGFRTWFGYVACIAALSLLGFALGYSAHHYLVAQ